VSNYRVLGCLLILGIPFLVIGIFGQILGGLMTEGGYEPPAEKFPEHGWATSAAGYEFRFEDRWDEKDLCVYRDPDTHKEATVELPNRETNWSGDCEVYPAENEGMNKLTGEVWHEP